MDYYIIKSDELYHHGIKGQRWGVRRYQNYDGSYTQAGLKRYDIAKSNLDKAKTLYNDNKITRSDYRIAKKAEKEARRQLKYDYFADKGAEFYKKGHTIFGDRMKGVAIQAGLNAAARTAWALGKNAFERKDIKGVRIAEIALGSAAFASTVNVTRRMLNTKHARAYNSHSSKRVTNLNKKVSDILETYGETVKVKDLTSDTADNKD